MTKSESIDLLATALSKAQAELLPATKDAKNPFFKSEYATLEAVWEAARGALTKNNLSIVQATEYQKDGGIVVLNTTLLHGSGQWIESTYPVLPVKPDPQSLGSALSYARRYGLASMIGVVQTDDDASAASGKNISAPTDNATRTEQKGPALASKPAEDTVLPFDQDTPIRKLGETVLNIGKLSKYTYDEILSMPAGEKLITWANTETLANRPINPKYSDLLAYAIMQGAV